MKIEMYPILVVLLLLTAGCVWSTSEAPSGAKIKFEGSFNISDNFTMSGQITNLGKETPPFENVAVYLYDDSETLIQSARVGTLEYESNQFSIQSERLPEYIIIHSEEFWTVDEIDVEYYARVNAERQIPYDPYIVTAKDELPAVSSTN